METGLSEYQSEQSNDTAELLQIWTERLLHATFGARHYGSIMDYTLDQAAFVLGEVRRTLERNEPDDLKVRRLWHAMALLRAHILAQTMRHHIGTRIAGGPFKGMKLTEDVLIGLYAPALLGIYEHELQPIIERLVGDGFDTVLNIGCSYGYYAVGLALRMPQARILAFDTDPAAQKKCADMADANGVAERVEIGGLFDGKEFAKYAGQKTLAFVDIEGGEIELLDPAQYPALLTMTILVEMHDLFDSATSQNLQARFASTHAITRIDNRSMVAELEGIGYVDPFDKFILAWEDRGGPTPWALMLPKNH